MVATKRTSNPSAQVVLLLLSQNSASCALKASGSRAWMTGRATVRVTWRTSTLFPISAIPSSTPKLSPHLVSASGALATRIFLLLFGCSSSSIKPRGSPISSTIISPNRLTAKFPPAHIQDALIRSRPSRIVISTSRTYIAGHLLNQKQVSSVVAPVRKRRRKIDWRRTRKSHASGDVGLFDA